MPRVIAKPGPPPGPLPPRDRGAPPEACGPSGLRAPGRGVRVRPRGLRERATRPVGRRAPSPFLAGARETDTRKPQCIGKPFCSGHVGKSLQARTRVIVPGPPPQGWPSRRRLAEAPESPEIPQASSRHRFQSVALLSLDREPGGG